MMNQILLIARKDLRTYFYSPVAYIVIAMFLGLTGWMFSNLLSYYAQNLQTFSAINFAQQKPNLSENVIRPLFGNMNVLFLFVAPFITMRLLAEEKKDHTIELLLTAPCKAFHITFGKFLAGLSLMLIMTAFTFVYAIILQVTASPDWGVVIASYVGLIFICASYTALGLFWSSRTENQIVAAVLTFGTILFFWLISWAAHRAGPFWSEVLTYLSLIGHYSNFAQGLFDTTDIVFYLSFTGFALFLTNLSVDSH